VIVDGFISTAGALIAHQLQPVSREYMFAAHQSVETGHKTVLEKIGLSPILNLNMRLGEGTGAALAMPIIEASIKILTEMATFQDAGVSEQIS
jgi:nicotinate-nucleotide--dimethylbenzimidazole phosphoribosyltransferase